VNILLSYFVKRLSIASYVPVHHQVCRVTFALRDLRLSWDRHILHIRFCDSAFHDDDVWQREIAKLVFGRPNCSIEIFCGTWQMPDETINYDRYVT